MQLTAQPESLLGRYEGVRARTREIFGLLAPDAFDQRPIALRHPIRFYEGHLASFNFGMLRQSGSVESDPQPELTTLFARGIDPLDEAAADRASIHKWPERAVVQSYAARIEELMDKAFREGVEPLYLHTAIEHEEMHQETLMYLIHRLPHELKQAPRDAIVERGVARRATWQTLEGARVQLGADPEDVTFGWDNEFPRHDAEVPAFELQSRKVTNGDFLEFLVDDGYRRADLWGKDAWGHVKEANIGAPPYWERRDEQWFLRAAFEDLPLPLEWPVFVSHIEAQAYARWRGARLPSEPEWHRACASAEAPNPEQDNFAFTRWNPAPVADGQLAGNGWEWTSTVFAGFPGFNALPHYPGYSSDFFDDRHFVLKGASPVTPAALVRPGFRNWFQDQYRHAYSAFRCARDV